MLGDESGYTAGEHQKMKIAVIEGMWHTEPAPAGFNLVGFPDMEARETRYAIRIPWVLGLIATRSLTTEIPGIIELVERAKAHIGQGVKAYDALTKIRAAKGGPVADEVRAAFENNGTYLGYAYLLKRYVDDPRQATPDQISKAAWDTVPNVWPLVLVVPDHGRPWDLLHCFDCRILFAPRCDSWNAIPGCSRSPSIRSRCLGLLPSLAGSSQNLAGSRG